MMYPRLALLRQFLTDDGVIFISIDDNELANLLLLMEEFLGSQNYLATIVWEKGKKGDSKFFSENHEYVVAYARNKAVLVAKNTKWKKRKSGVDKVLAHYQSLREKYVNKHEDIRTEMMKWYRALPKEDPAKAHKHYNWSDDRGLYFAADFSGPDDGRDSRPRHDIFHPITGKPCKKPSTGWRWDEAHTLIALTEDPPRIHFGPDEKTIPCRKSYLVDVSQEPFPTVFYKDGRAATLAVEQLLGKGRFAFPKDAEVIADLVGMVSEPGDIILDSFGGSGTTGQAVLQLNAEGGVPRRFVMVQMAYESDEQKAHEQNIARDITAERVRRVARGYKNAKGLAVTGLGGGFRYCELGEPLFDETGRIRECVRFADLARHVYFTTTGETLPRERINKSPLIGITSNGVAIYLLYNGILKDKSPTGGNVLTSETLNHLPPHKGPKIVYAAACRLSEARRTREQIKFMQTPYAIKTS
jgi:adenine-specific DNA-methyltransferase